MYVEILKGIKNGWRFEIVEEFLEYLIIEKCILIVLWDDVGYFVRFFVIFEVKIFEDEIRVMEEFKRRFFDVEFEF